MKRILFVVAAVAFATGCSGNSGTTGGGSNTTSSGSNGSGSSASSGSSGRSSSSSTGSTGLTNGSTGLNASTSGSNGSGSTTASNGSGSTTATNGSGSGSGSGGSTGGDLCTNAIAQLTPQQVGDPAQTVQGDDTGANDNYESPDCGGFGGDVSYTLHLTENAQVTASVDVTSTTASAMVDIVADCAGTTEVACNVGGGSGTPATVTKSLTAGDYIVVVNNYSGDEGPFSLTVSLDTYVPPPPGETCAAPTTLTDNGSGSFSASGDNTPYADDFISADCGGSGPDVFYALHIDADSSVTATVTPTPVDGGTLEPVVTILSGCGGTDAQICGNPIDVGQPTTVTAPHLTGPGDYIIAVDGYSGTVGTFDLSVQVGAPIPPPANDTCATAQVIDPTTLATPTSGTTVESTSDYDYSSLTNCAGNDGSFSTPGGDVVYSFTPATTGTYDIVVTPTDSSLDAVLNVSDACPATSSCLGSADLHGSGTTGAETVTGISLTAGTAYFITVSAYSTSTSGPFTLTITPN